MLYQRGQYLMTKLKHVNCVTHDTPQSAPPPLIDTVSNSVGFCLGHQVSSTCAAVAAQNGDESLMKFMIYETNLNTLLPSHQPHTF